MKCSLTTSKTKKIESLQEQNLFLENQLCSVLTKSLQVSHSLKEQQRQYNCIETEIEVERMRQSLLLTGIGQIQQECGNLRGDLQKLEHELGRVRGEAKIVCGRVDAVRRELMEREGLVARMRAELQGYRNMGNSHIIKTSQTLKKTHESLLRALTILTNKLHSHKKYLTILQKKQQKAKKQSQPIQTSNNPKTKSTTNLGKKEYLYQRKEPIQENCQEAKKKQAVKDLERKKIREFDHINRKRNQILGKAVGKF